MTTSTKSAPKNTTATTAPKAFDLNQFATVLTTADKNAKRVPAVKMAIACYVVANHMQEGINQSVCLDLYGVPAAQRTRANRDTSRLFNQATGYWKDYAKYVNENRQYFTKFFDSLKALEFKGTFAQLADRILDADIYGEMGAPVNKKEWLEFLGGYLPKDETKAEAKDETKAETKAETPKSTTANAKDNADKGEAQRAADTNVHEALTQMLAKVESHVKALVNDHMEQLDAGGLPKKYRAMVGGEMHKLAESVRADILAQMEK